MRESQLKERQDNVKISGIKIIRNKIGNIYILRKKRNI